MAFEKNLRIQQISRITFALGTCAALILAVGRCSPISPSVSKASLRAGNGEETAKSTSASIPDPQTSIAQPISAKGHVIDGTTYLEITDGEKAFARQAPDIALTESQIAELKSGHKTTIQIAGTPPQNCAIYLEVALPINALEANPMPEIDMTIQPLVNTTWLVKLKATGDVEKDRAIDLALSQLQNAVVSFPKAE